MNLQDCISKDFNNMNTWESKEGWYVQFISGDIINNPEIFLNELEGTLQEDNPKIKIDFYFLFDFWYVVIHKISFHKPLKK